jgi:hypothetical protein
MKRKPLVDPKIYELAHAFLCDIQGATDADTWQLAAAIQGLCDDECRSVEERETSRRVKAAQDILKSRRTEGVFS